MTDRETDPLQIEALEWFARMKDETIRDSDKVAFQAWLRADPSHAAAFARAQALWDRFGIVKPEYDRMQRAKVTRRRAILGGLGLIVAAPTAYYLSQPGFFADYTTDVAERRSFTLPDGSEVELGSYSALSVDFSTKRRGLTLYRGQGFFRVAAMPERPFFVEAGYGDVEALGTRFDVKLFNGQSTVSVLEHSVLIRSGGRPALTVGEGMQVSYNDNALTDPKPFDAATVEAWRYDRMIFEDVPLRRVLKELERYRHGRIILMDERLGNIPVTAVLETKEASRALDVIADTLPIRVLDVGGYMAIVFAR